jgi:plasmid stabilization system protein ParE
MKKGPLKVRTLPSADADLRHIAVYVATDNPAAARELVARIQERIRTLADFPAQGRPVSRQRRVLAIAGTPYLAFYRIAKGEVIVLRVRHGKQLRRLP